MTTKELADAATTIWAAAEGCIDYPHLDRIALPAPTGFAGGTVEDDSPADHPCDPINTISDRWEAHCARLGIEPYGDTF